MKKSVLFLFMALYSIGLMAQSSVTGPGNAAPVPSVATVVQDAITGIFSGTEAVPPIATQIKPENFLHPIVDIDQGIVNLYLSYGATSNLTIRVSIKDANNKRYMVGLMIPTGADMDTVYPKYDAPITMADVISITPQEDETFYYTF